MRLVCPSCGAVHSAEAWSNDPVARQCLKLACEMPHAVSSRCFAYLALFRSPGRSLQWKTVLNLLAELKTRVSESHIQWKRQVARPNSASAWGEGMERMIENPPPKLPLKGHGYLRSVVYEICNDLDKQAEVKRNKSERDGSFHKRHSGESHNRHSGESHNRHSGESRNPVAPERMTAEDMKAIRKKNYRNRKKI